MREKIISRFPQSEYSLIDKFIGPLNAHMCMSPTLQRGIIREALVVVKEIDRTEKEFFLLGEFILMNELPCGTVQICPERGGRKFLLAQLKKVEGGYTVIYDDKKAYKKVTN